MDWAANLSYAGAEAWRLPFATDKFGAGLLPTSSSQAYSNEIKGEMRHLFDQFEGTLGLIISPSSKEKAECF